MDKKAWISKHCKFAQYSDPVAEIEPLLAGGLVEDSEDFSQHKYRVTGVPEEFGRWYIWWDEKDDGRGSTLEGWEVIQEDIEGNSNIWENLPTAEDAYQWIMRHHSTVDQEDQLGQSQPEQDIEGRIYDLNAKGPHMTPEESAELQSLIQTRGTKPRYMASLDKWMKDNCISAKRRK